MFVPRFPPFVFLSGIDRCFDGIHKFSRFSLLVYTHIVYIYIYIYIIHYVSTYAISYRTIPHRLCHTIHYIAVHHIASHEIWHNDMTWHYITKHNIPEPNKTSNTKGTICLFQQNMFPSHCMKLYFIALHGNSLLKDKHVKLCNMFIRLVLRWSITDVWCWQEIRVILNLMWHVLIIS